MPYTPRSFTTMRDQADGAIFATVSSKRCACASRSAAISRTPERLYSSQTSWGRCVVLETELHAVGVHAHDVADVCRVLQRREHTRLGNAAEVRVVRVLEEFSPRGRTRDGERPERLDGQRGGVVTALRAGLRLDAIPLPAFTAFDAQPFEVVRHATRIRKPALAELRPIGFEPARGQSHVRSGSRGKRRARMRDRKLTTWHS